MLCILVEPVGIEPTVFLMSLIYSQLPSPLGTRLQIEFESSVTTVIDTIHLICTRPGPGLGTPLGILVQRVYFLPGFCAPRCFTLSSPSKKPITA